MNRELDIAWAAGFFDGEGFITIGRRSGKYRGHYLRAGVNHVAIAPLIKLQNLFGGSIQSGHKVYGNRKPRHRWIVNTSKAKEVLDILKPYLVNKQDAADIGLAFQDRVTNWKQGMMQTDEEYNTREKLKAQLIAVNEKD